MKRMDGKCNESMLGRFFMSGKSEGTNCEAVELLNCRE